ncbi:50S ribosomal protein L6 [Candidatus Woesearchaeota archaeon]|jgi:large subunit ribosomal protein L6|nr:50S ribosomal protein L6 [Candidatus Woesearchaeota archaeon]
MKNDLREEIELPQGVTVTIGDLIKVTGPKGEVEKKLSHPRVDISLQDNKIVLESKKVTKREIKNLNTFRAHLRNMVQGVQEKFIYTVKICSGHFPMNVSVSKNELIIKNFLGESHPRKLPIKPGAEVKIEGTEVIISSCSKETAGQTAAGIEQLCRITNRDNRIFQDGCYIINKAGKEI